MPRVVSINASGHKYGLVFPGVGWLIWRDADALPEDLIFDVNYLGDDMPTFALNFSRPGARSSRSTTTSSASASTATPRCRVRARCRDAARRQIAELGPFELLTHGDELPVFAFTLNDDVERYTVFDISDALRERGWQVPRLLLPGNRTDLAVMRIVVRHGFTHDLRTCSSTTSSGSYRTSSARAARFTTRQTTKAFRH